VKSTTVEEVFKESGSAYFIVASGGHKKKGSDISRFPVG
jgi:hypothetical protein